MPSAHLRAGARSQAALQESEERYRLLVELSPDAILVCREGRIRFVNPAGVALLSGGSGEAVVGHSLVEFIHADDRRVAAEWVAEAEAAMPTHQRTELRCVRRDGKLLYVEATATAVSSGGRQVVQAVMRDITERKQTEERSRRRILDAQERVRREVAERLHGTVQSRLVALWLRLSQCQALLTESPAAARILAEVQEQLDILREVEVRGLSHQLHPAIVQFGLGVALRVLRDEFDRAFDIVLEIDEPLERTATPLSPGMEAVFLTVYRVAEEFLSNSTKHAEASRVAIQVKVEGSATLMVTFTDDGVGFDPSTTERGGLGLVIMRDYVKALGGTLALESAPGAGTRVSVRLPMSGGRP